MGLKVGTVKLENYNTKWSEEFDKEKKCLEELLGGRVLSIEHVGSTSIPGIKAKPIIDIMIVVKKLEEVENFKHLFKVELGYDFRDDKGKDNEYLVRKGSTENRTHLIHIVEVNSEKYFNFVNFRNYLLNHKDYITKYEKLKEELALKYKDDRKSYTAAKNDFIKQVLNLCKEEK